MLLQMCLVLNSELVSELGDPFFGSVSSRISPLLSISQGPISLYSSVKYNDISSEFQHPALSHNICPYLGQSGKREKGKYWRSLCFGLNLGVYQIDMLRPKSP